MYRTFCWLFAILAISMTGRAVAEDKKPAAGKEARPQPKYFDVDKFFEEFDKNKDGFLTKDELPQGLRHGFDKIDTNKDGKLSRDEVQRGFAFLQPRRRPSDVVFVLIEMSDCDDGCTDEVQRIYDVMRQMDKNKDGKIDADELKAMRQQIVNDRIAALFEELDTNKDGKISRSEAAGEIRRNFDTLDVNKDGFIDREELMHAAMAKHPTTPTTAPAPVPSTRTPSK
jgi:Ca2+-binding EF-hand superfamily protein